MPFLALNGTTYAVRSNSASEKNEEHGVDRERMFDGSLRQTKRGDFRQWDLTSKLLTNADALTLCTLLKSSSLPLAMSGDLCGDDCAVMPVLISNNPVQTADGFRRQVVFTLRETPQALPPDTSAVPFLFLRRATDFFSNDAGTVAALTGDQVAVWKDQTGNNRHWTQDGGLFANTAVRPLRDGESIQLGHGSSPQSWLDSPSVSTMTQAEMLISIKSDNDPALDAAQNQPYGAGAGGASVYPSTDGHIYDAFFSNTSFNWGDPTEDLTEWNVIDVYASGTVGYAGRLNNVVKATGIAGVDFTYGNPGSFSIGNVSGGGFFKGNVRDIVMFDGILTTAQRRSWYDYLRSAVDDPPFVP